MGFWTRVKLAFAAFFTILFKGRLPAAFERDQPVTTSAAPPAVSAAAPTPPAPTPETSDRAVQMLALLQRDGRFIDFLMEDLAAYSDAQVGAAVRDVHAGCRGVVSRYVTLDAVVSGKEGEQTTVDTNLDPASIRLVGNVTGQPPFRGTLLHRGWRATRLELPPLAPHAARQIVAPAEIEVA
jgi:Domain of unknown function (DUF2760)